jgi:hypothetical protein
VDLLPAAKIVPEEPVKKSTKEIALSRRGSGRPGSRRIRDVHPVED